MALSDNSRRRSNSVAFGAKLTLQRCRSGQRFASGMTALPDEGPLRRCQLAAIVTARKQVTVGVGRHLDGGMSEPRRSGDISIRPPCTAASAGGVSLTPIR